MIGNRVARAAARASIRLKGRSIGYERARGGSATLRVVRGNTDHEEEDARGTAVAIRSDDWLILPGDFRTAFGADAVPEDGDKITADGREFRVKPFGREPCYRPQDEAEAFWRVHSKDFGAIEGEGDG